jgi:hypothetical protein
MIIKNSIVPKTFKVKQIELKVNIEIFNVRQFFEALDTRKGIEV